MAPNKYAELWRLSLSRTMGGREPTGAQMYSRLPFWPTRASSWSQILIGLPAAMALARVHATFNRGSLSPFDKRGVPHHAHVKLRSNTAQYCSRYTCQRMFVTEVEASEGDSRHAGERLRLRQLLGPVLLLRLADLCQATTNRLSPRISAPAARATSEFDTTKKGRWTDQSKPIALNRASPCEAGALFPLMRDQHRLPHSLRRNRSRINEH
jgi:hypothetical protein